MSKSVLLSRLSTKKICQQTGIKQITIHCLVSIPNSRLLKRVRNSAKNMVGMASQDKWCAFGSCKMPVGGESHHYRRSRIPTFSTISAFVVEHPTFSRSCQLGYQIAYCNLVYANFLTHFISNEQ